MVGAQHNGNSRTKRRNAGDKGFRLIHIRIPADVHRRMRVLVAERDTTIQSFVAQLIQEEIGRAPEH